MFVPLRSVFFARYRSVGTHLGVDGGRHEYKAEGRALRAALPAARANLAHLGQSRPYYGFGFQVKVLFPPKSVLFARYRANKSQTPMARGVQYGV